MRVRVRLSVVANGGPRQWCEGRDMLPAVQLVVRAGWPGGMAGKGAVSREGGGTSRTRGVR